MRKRIFGIVILIVIFGGLSALVAYDYSMHAEEGVSVIDSIIHYVIHILVCITFCTVFHKPVHDFSNWVRGLVGFKHNDDTCPHN